VTDETAAWWKRWGRWIWTGLAFIGGIALAAVLVLAGRRPAAPSTPPRDSQEKEKARAIDEAAQAKDADLLATAEADDSDEALANLVDARGRR